MDHGRVDSLHWYIVLEEHPAAMTVYISYVDHERNLLIATTLMTTDSLEPRVRICELEEVLKTIRIVDNETAANMLLQQAALVPVPTPVEGWYISS